MKAVEYLKTKARMTDCCNTYCGDCLLHSTHNGTGLTCGRYEVINPEKAIEIVEKWAKENPVKTYLSVLLEKLPDTKISGESGTPEDFCPHSVFKIKKDFDYCNTNTCKDCWNREYKEEK